MMVENVNVVVNLLDNIPKKIHYYKIRYQVIRFH
jgi:hypothetical protein